MRRPCCAFSLAYQALSVNPNGRYTVLPTQLKAVTEFVHAYEKLEQKLNNDYREQPKIKEIFATRSGEVFSEFLRKSTNNRMNDLFAPSYERLKRILHGMG